MAHKVTVGGTGYEILGGRTLIDGVGYGVSSGKTLVDGTSRDIQFASYDPVFVNNEWSAIIGACQNNQVPDTWLVGDNKVMLINGVNYQIDIIGKYHDVYTDGGTAPLTLRMHTCFDTPYKLNNSTDVDFSWSACDFRKTYIPNIISTMPSDVQLGIKHVQKEYGSSSGLYSVSDTLFVLSEKEIIGSKSSGAREEGTQYEYYSDTTNTGLLYCSATNDGVNRDCWTRSYATSSGYHFYAVYASCPGIFSPRGWTKISASDNMFYIALAFCF